jgi:hypothetical protein
MQETFGRPESDRPLDCGHSPSPLTYAEERDTDRRICDECARAADRRELRETGKGSGYLTRDVTGRAIVSTWPGLELLSVFQKPTVTKRRGFYGATYEDVTFRAVDTETGAQYAGRGPGFGMYCRVRRIKGTR